MLRSSHPDLLMLRYIKSRFDDELHPKCYLDLTMLRSMASGFDDAAFNVM